MKIALTGSTGFIGSHLVNKLSKIKGIRIYTFNKDEHSLLSPDSLKKFVKDKDAIFHLAGIVNSDKVTDLYEINTIGTLNLLETISNYGKQNAQFIFPSSFAVYEELSSQELLDEDNTKTIPRNSYGMSKLLAEEIIKFYNRKKKIKSKILRIANVYGPGTGGKSFSIIASTVNSIINEKTIIINGNGKQARDFVYIDDVTDTFISALYSSKDFLLINICSGTETRIINIIQKVEEILQKRAKIQYNTTYSEKGYWIGSFKKALKNINFKPKTNLDEGLKKTISWYLKNSS